MAKQMSICLLFVLSLWALRAVADLQAGLEAYGRGDYETALEEFRPLAEKGEAEAQFLLGLMYGNGDGVSQSNEEAAKWFRLAAEQGLAKAQTFLGDLNHDGLGVAKDLNEALKWYRLAVDQGDTLAEVSLGKMYLLGEGVPQEDQEALKLFHRASNEGHPQALFLLGAMYHTGRGTAQDHVEGHKWMTLAAELGEPSAEQGLRVVSSEMTPTEIARERSGQRLGCRPTAPERLAKKERPPSLRPKVEDSYSGAKDADTAIDCTVGGPSKRDSERSQAPTCPGPGE